MSREMLTLQFAERINKAAGGRLDDAVLLQTLFDYADLGDSWKYMGLNLQPKNVVGDTPDLWIAVLYELTCYERAEITRSLRPLLPSYDRRGFNTTILGELPNLGSLRKLTVRDLRKIGEVGRLRAVFLANAFRKFEPQDSVAQ